MIVKSEDFSQKQNKFSLGVLLQCLEQLVDEREICVLKKIS